MSISFLNGDSFDLAHFYREGKRSKSIPLTIANALKRKLTILESAEIEQDLRNPPGNHYEQLSGNLAGWSSIRVNIQWRLIFRWSDGEAHDVYLDPHNY